MSFPTNPTIVYRLIRQEFPHIGVTVPPALIDGWEQITSHNLPDFTVTADELGEAIVEALANGRDLDTDPELTRLATRRSLSALGVPEAVEQYLDGLRSQLLRDQGDAVVAALTEAFDQAAAEIEAARLKIPNLDLSSNDAVTRVPAHLMTTWGKANDAQIIIDRIVNVWVIVGTFTHNLYLSPGTRALITADLGVEEISALPGTQHALYPVRYGYPLSLATFEGFRERVARVQTETAERDRKAQAARREALRTIR